MFEPIVKDNLDILFVGINPHPKSKSYFSNNKSFWYQLHESGLTKEIIDSSKLLECNYGIMNIIDRPTVKANELTKEEWEEGLKNLKKITNTCNPKVICLLSRGIYEKQFKTKAPYGFSDKQLWQSKVFVSYFPTARISKTKKIELLKTLVKQ